MYDPVYHYSPSFGWMNDPNGLYYLDGIYHLFYQYNPTDSQFGNMSWGHATSTDLVNWAEQDVALEYSDAEWIFSGSAVVDHDNTSGFGYGEDGEPPVVAIYTSFILPQDGNPMDQEQSIAYSLDNGETWTRYDGNPVLDIGNPEFRDPKVFWQDNPGDDDYWVMSIVRATDHTTDFYRSDDLKDWDYMSSFGKAHAVGGVWEVPDLIEMEVENTGETKWLLIQNINPGGIQGGSAAQYFIGDWDGTSFTADTIRTAVPQDSTVVEDFENGTYDGWTVTGTAFGSAPVAGTLPFQNTVSGYLGERLVNSFLTPDGSSGDGGTGRMISDRFTITEDFINLKVGGGGHAWDLSIANDIGAPGGEVIADFDFGLLPEGWTATGDFVGIRPSAGGNADFQDVHGYDGEGLINTFDIPDGTGDGSTGTIESDAFTITRDFINLKVGGGRWTGDGDPLTRVELVVDGEVVRYASGEDSNELRDIAWDVSAFEGQSAQIRIVDANSGAWGQILVDSIEQNDVSVLDAPPGGTASVYEDFESGAALPAGWTADGDFTNGFGTTENLMIDGRAVSGYDGARLLSTFWKVEPDSAATGDSATGTVTSDTFTISDAWINLKVGGGGHTGDARTAVELIVDGEVVRSANGGFVEGLDWSSWDVSEFAGQDAQIRVVDQNTGGFGYLLVDQIEFSDTTRRPEQTAPTAVNLIVDGERVATATGNFTEELDWESWDVSQYAGQEAQIEIVDRNTGDWGHINVDQILQSSSAARTSAELADWIDWGADHYATISWNNLPDGSDPTVISWMNNWSYSGAIPTGDVRGSMTLAREYSLREVDGEIRLVQRPTDAVENLRQEHFGVDDFELIDRKVAAPMDGKALEIRAIFDADDATATVFGVNVRVGDEEQTRIGYDVEAGEVFVDRTGSGQIPSELFAAVHAAPLEIQPDGTVELRLFVDTASVELFANGGLRTITDQIFPDENSIGVELFADGGAVDIDSFDVWRLSSDEIEAEPAPLAYLGDASDNLVAAHADARDRADALDERLTFRGLAGDDIVIGSEGNDEIYGGNGDDVIHAGGGRNDHVWGGEGQDTFVFGSQSDDGLRDRTMIFDFDAGLDRLDFGDATIDSVKERGNNTLITLDGDGDVVSLQHATGFDEDWLVA